MEQSRIERLTGYRAQAVAEIDKWSKRQMTAATSGKRSEARSRKEYNESWLRRLDAELATLI